jgi:hypothetical protein|tara:strand:- start:646 stop:867 length:222 start_codon:yes stop_codon:yes gene_type:complete
MISYSWSMPKIETDTVAKRKECPWSKVPSLDTRRTGAIPKPKSIKSTEHTIAPAYNKGAYQVISKQNIKDIGR